MVTTGTATTITWVLKATDNFPVANIADLDVMIKDPDGTVAYKQTAGIGEEGYTQVTGVLPTATVDGEMSITHTPSAAGVYEYILAHGTPGVHTIIDSVVVSVIDGTTAVSSTVFTPSA